MVRQRDAGQSGEGLGGEMRHAELVQQITRRRIARGRRIGVVERQFRMTPVPQCQRFPETLTDRAAQGECRVGVGAGRPVVAELVFDESEIEAYAGFISAVADLEYEAQAIAQPGLRCGVAPSQPHHFGQVVEQAALGAAVSRRTREGECLFVIALGRRVPLIAGDQAERIEQSGLGGAVAAHPGQDKAGFGVRFRSRVVTLPHQGGRRLAVGFGRDDGRRGRALLQRAAGGGKHLRKIADALGISCAARGHFGPLRIVSELLGELFQDTESRVPEVVGGLHVFDSRAYGQQIETTHGVGLADKRQRAIDMVERSRVRVACRRIVGGAPQIVDGVASVAGTLVMLGDKRQVGRAALTGEPCGDLAMSFALDALQYAVVRDLMQHVVLEDVFAHAFESGRLSCEYQFAPGQPRQRLGCFVVQRQQGVFPEHMTDDRCELQCAAFLRRERIEARLQDAGERGRDMGVGQARGDDAPAFGIGHDDAVVDQHLDQFLHVERVAFATAGDQFAKRRGYVREPLQQHSCKCATFVPRQLRKVDARVDFLSTAPQGSAFIKCGTSEPDDQERHVAATGHEVIDEIERPVVGPVQVVEHQQHGVAVALA